MTAYQFSQPWLSKLQGDQAMNAKEWAHLRMYLKGLDDGSIPLFNLNSLNATIQNFTPSGNIAMGGFKLTGLGAGSTNGDSLRYEQLIGLYLLLTGGTMSGAIAMGSNKVTGLTDGTATSDAASFGQVSNVATNILDNGGYEIWQRGTSFSNPANATYLADRWKCLTNEAATVTVTKEPTTIDSGLASMKVVVSGSGASKYWFAEERIENYQEYFGKTVTVSVRVKSSVANAIRVWIDDNVTSAQSSYHTGGGGWETLTVTKTVSSSAAFLAVYVGMAGTGDKKDGTYYWDSAMLTGGSSAIAFIPTNPQVDFSRCQRFFWVYGSDQTGTYLTVTQAQSTTVGAGFITYPVPMRADPTATVNNVTNFQLLDATAGVHALSSLGIGTLGTTQCRIEPVVASGLVAGNASVLRLLNVNASVYFSADL